MTIPRNSFRKPVLMLASLALALPLAACGGSSAGDDSEVRLAIYPPNFLSWCDFVAIDKGFYEEAGVTVGEPLSVQGDADGLRALQSGEVDIAQVTNIVQVVASGEVKDKPIMIAQQSDMPASFVGPGEANAGLESLKGLRIALPPEGQATTAVAIDALNEALGPKGYEPIFAGGGGSARVAALQAGAVDAAFVFAPLDSAVQKDDPKLNILASIDSGPTRYAGGVYVASASWLKKNSEAASGWASAYSKGCKWIQDPANQDEAIDILAKQMDLDEDVIQEAYDEYVANGDRSPSATGEVDLEGVQNVQEALISAGYQKTEVDAESLIDNSFITGTK